MTNDLLLLLPLSSSSPFSELNFDIYFFIYLYINFYLKFKIKLNYLINFYLNLISLIIYFNYLFI